MRRISLAAFAFGLTLPSLAAAQQPELGPRIDGVFAWAGRDVPGCTVGAGKDGRTLYTHGYGAANLEYGVPLTDSSVMESGSVAKQFTAAALVLLAQDGKLSLDDDIRKYLPEVPDFHQRITIRNLLTHTSGLRDQWGLLGIEGRGPGSQVHSPATTLDLVVHQKMLNFPVGSEYLYSNTGYALAGIIASRVSGKSLNEFLQERLFTPLGMTHTQLRDDFTKVVPNRATAYSKGPDGQFHQDMPFTNMIGNGGVLSTMSDLMKWNENLDRTTVGGPSFTETMQTRMRLTNGRTITYALGLEVVDYQGVREVSHSGSTAGYRTFLARYPDQHVSVAVWCSNASANPTALAHQVADLLLVKPPRAAVQAGAPAVHVERAALARWAGLYRDVHTDQVVSIDAADSVLTLSTRVPTRLTPAGNDRFVNAATQFAFHGAGASRTFTLATAAGDTSRFVAVKAAANPVPLRDYAGTYTSDELDARFVLSVRNGKLVAFRRPSDEMELRPVYADGFTSPGLGSIRFTRDAAGAVSGFSIFAGRVLDVRFTRAR